MGLALTFAAAPVLAQPVSTAPLAPREVLLEVTAAGTVRTRGDIAIVVAVASSQGGTEAEARAANATLTGRLTAAAQSAGTAAGDIRVNNSPTMMDFSRPELVQQMMAGDMAGQAGVDTSPSQTVRSLVELKIRDVARVEAVREALREAGAAQVTAPNYSLTDDRPARSRARTEAVATARASAEGYATALGMRVVRILRVSERMGLDSLASFINDPGMMRRMRSLGASPDPEVETQVVIAIDFALVPQ